MDLSRSSRPEPETERRLALLKIAVGAPFHVDSAEALFESEQLLSAYSHASRVGVCLLDTELRYLAINQTLAGMNGIPVEAHLGKTIRQVLGDFAEMVEPLFRNVLLTGHRLTDVEISFILQNRSEPGHWIEHYIPIKDSSGKVKRIGVVAVEVTEQKKLEESLRGVSKKLKEEKKRQQVMAEVSRVLSAKWNARDGFPKISAFLRRVIFQEYAALAIHDEKSGQLVRVALDFPLAWELWSRMPFTRQRVHEEKR